MMSHLPKWKSDSADSAVGLPVRRASAKRRASRSSAPSGQRPDFRLWNAEEFIAQLHEIGARAYHDKHPFHVGMNEGRLSPEQLRGWIANRFYYQRNIPRKDAAIIANCPLREVRRVWIHRITDHDGDATKDGGIEAWLRLGEAAGLTRDELLQDRHVVPGTRFAVNAYVNFARTQPWPVAIASSLTELFAPDLMAARLAAFEKFYPWIDAAGLDYFRRRLTQARRDSDEALAMTVDHCNTPELQREAVRALEFKCDVLWSLLDSIHHAYGAPSLQSSPWRRDEDASAPGEGQLPKPRYAREINDR